MQHEPQLAVLEGVVVPVAQQRASGRALDGCVAGGVRAQAAVWPHLGLDPLPARKVVLPRRRAPGFTGSVNLWPLVLLFYRLEVDGAVVELRHCTCVAVCRAVSRQVPAELRSGACACAWHVADGNNAEFALAFYHRDQRKFLRLRDTTRPASSAAFPSRWNCSPRERVVSFLELSPPHAATPLSRSEEESSHTD